jgi:hypothetical protein
MGYTMSARTTKLPDTWSVGRACDGSALARILILFLSLLDAAPGIADDLQQDWTIEPGVYHCLTSRMIGLHGEAADRFAGKIKLTREQQRFWVKIGAPQFDDYEPDFCSRYPAVPGAKVSLIVWWHCAADSEATFSENKSILPMRGNVNTEPGQYRQLPGGSFFKLFPDLTYVLFDAYDSKKRFYLEEGACEKL